MPIAQYQNVFKKPPQHVTRNIPNPKRITELKYWLKMCQQWIPEIPRQIAESEMSANRQMGSDGWFVSNTDVDIKWIKFNLENKLGEKATIVIDRRKGIL